MKAIVRIRQRPEEGIQYDVDSWAWMLSRAPKEWAVNGKTYPVVRMLTEGFRGQSAVCLELDIPDDELWALVQEPVRRGRPSKEG